MKFIKTLYIPLFLFIIASCSHQIATTRKKTRETAGRNETLCTYTVSNNKDALNLHIKVPENIGFYGSSKTTLQNAQQTKGCEVICTPLSGQKILTDDGYELKDITIDAFVENTPTNDCVRYTIREKINYAKKTGLFSIHTKNVEHVRSGTVKNPHIDLTKEAKFSVSSKEATKASITFANAPTLSTEEK